MAPRFICKTALPAGRALRSPGGPLLDAYPRLHAALVDRLGAAEAELLAEPIATGAADGDGTSVSWYSDASGTPAQLTTLPPDRRARIEQRLRDTLARLLPLMADPAIGPVLERALCLRAEESIWAVDELPVLVEWGSVPDGLQPGMAPSEMLRRSPLGRFLPSDAPAPVAAPPARPAAPAAAPAPVPVPVAAAAARPGLGAAWLVLPAALAVAALFLALGYWRGSILAADRAAARNNTVSVLDDDTARRALEQQNALNTALEAQIEERRKLLAGNVCVADPATLPRLGPDQAAVPSPTVVPPPPGGSPFQGNLADLLKQGTVMVLAAGGGGSLGVGTGFFIGPDLIATNRHVVEPASNGGKLAVVNAKLGKLVMAQLVAASPNSDIGSIDIALLRVPVQAGVQPLSFTQTASELDLVIAAGYPALVTGSDANMRRLLEEGDTSVAPALVLTDGRINAIQTSPGGIRIMPHGAAVSPGNSGGPLVDGCGRVVGINTFIRADAESAAHANYAQKTDSLLAFLRDNGGNPTELGGPCAPGAPAAPTPAPAPAPTPAATPAPAPPAR